MDLRTAHNQFIQQCQDGSLPRRADRTIKNYLMSFGLLLRWFPITLCCELSDGILLQFFRRGEKEREWKASTVITHRKNLSPFIDWCIKRGHLAENPLSNIPIPKLIKNFPDFYTEQEIDQIIYRASMMGESDFIRARNKAMVAVMLMTGLRRGELIALKATDVSFDQNCVRVRPETSKNRTPRVVPMVFRLKEILQSYWQEREKLGVNTYSFWASSTTGGPFTDHGLKHFVTAMTKELGFQFKPHKCRHTFATYFYRGTKDIVSVQQSLGHKDITTTMIYTHANQDDIKAALEKNPINVCF